MYHEEMFLGLTEILKDERRNTMRKRLLALLTIVALSGSLVLSTAALYGDAYAQPEKEVRILSTATGKGSRAVLPEIVAEFEKANPGVKVSIEWVSWADLQKKVMAGTAAGNPPDILTLMYAMASYFQALDLLLPVDDIIDKLGRDDYMPGTLPTIAGHNYIVPYYPYASALWYRTDLFKEKGLDPPRTWDELLHCAKALTEDTDGDGKVDRWGYAMALGDKRWTAQNFVMYYWTNAGKLFDENFDIVFDKSPHRERMLETFDFYKKLSKYTPPGSADYAWWETMNAFATGKVAMNNYFYRQLVVVSEKNPKLLPYTKCTYHPFKVRMSSMAGYSGFAIVKGGKGTEEAKKLVEFLMSGDNYIKWLHSLAGGHKPSRRALFESEKWLDHSLIKDYKDSLQVIMNNLEFGSYWPDEWKVEMPGKINPVAQPLFNSPIMNDMVKSVILFNEDPAKAIDVAAEKARKLVEEQRKLIPKSK
jgi:multiple sugar transport system substrate-binding protein